MNRHKLEDLDRWRLSPVRKPLVLRGARQVGKTWLMQEFGKKSYPDHVYVNLDKSGPLTGFLPVAKILPRSLQGCGFTLAAS